MTDRSQRPVWLGVDERRWDHVRVHLQLLQDERVTSYHLAVYLGLAAHAETASGRAFPSAATLARYGGMSDRKVRDVIKQLAEWRYLRVEPRDGAASTFFLLPPPPLQAVPGSDGTAAPDANPPRNAKPRTSAYRADEREGTRSREPGAPIGVRERGGDPDCKFCEDTGWSDIVDGQAKRCTACDPSRRVS